MGFEEERQGFMDEKQIMDKLLANVPEDERQDVVRRLVDAESLDERVEIARGYVGDGVEVADWLSEEFELSDEDLERIAGGDGTPWYTPSPYCDCSV